MEATHVQANKHKGLVVSLWSSGARAREDCALKGRFSSDAAF